MKPQRLVTSEPLLMRRHVARHGRSLSGPVGASGDPDHRLEAGIQLSQEKRKGAQLGALTWDLVAALHLGKLERTMFFSGWGD